MEKSYGFSEFKKLEKEFGYGKNKIINDLALLLEKSVKKNASDKKVGLLFSGGVDSSVIALILKKLNVDFTCYTTAFEDDEMQEAEDLVYARKAANALGLRLRVVKVKDVEKYIEKIIDVIEDCDVIKVGVGLPVYLGCREAKKDGCKVIFSGLGSEEIFGGYERHRKASDVNKECVNGLLGIYERDITRDVKISEFFGLELKVPFLDKELVEYSLRIPGIYKINKNGVKMILRESALKLGLVEEIALRKKRAAQYGSNFHKAIRKLSKKKGFKFIKDYLRSLFPLGALVSSGKDSLYAMHLMMKKGFDVKCLISVKSENPDSYMFHVPNVDLVKLQAESIGVPFLEGVTKGEKEKELKDLEKVLKEAKEKFGIKGIVTGAIFSEYQKKRIENVADKLNLKVFSPLWHMDQEKEIREIINNKFKFIITKIASEGLDKSWLGRVITEKDVDKLVGLNKKIGLNVAFEGGEAETLVIDAPLFKKKINIVDYEIKEESENVAEIVVKKAELVRE